jgi:hypothetical protein
MANCGRKENYFAVGFWHNTAKRYPTGSALFIMVLKNVISKGDTFYSNNCGFAITSARKTQVICPHMEGLVQVLAKVAEIAVWFNRYFS